MGHKKIIYGAAAGPGNGVPEGKNVPPVVSTRVAWADDWERFDDLHGVEMVWSLAPSIPVATLFYDYGRVRPLAKPKYKTLNPLAFNRRYVRLQFAGWNWYGVIRADEEVRQGALRGKNGDWLATGQQHLHCYGLEQLLSEHDIRNSVIRNLAGGVKIIARALTFNLNGKGNRSAERVNGVYLFEPNPDISHLWTSEQIVEYLLKHQTPHSQAGAVKVPFVLVGDDVPDFDTPEIAQEGSNTYSLLDRLINRQRLLTWWLEENGGNVDVRTATLTAAAVALDLPGAPEIAANPNTRDLIFDRDQLTAAAVKHSGVARFDQCVARGARMLAVGSFSQTLDNTVATGWETEHVNKYETGASGQGGYGALSPDDKRTRNAEVRSDPLMDNVFAFWKIPSNWDGWCGDGIGGAKKPCIAKPDDVNFSDQFYFREMFVQPTLSPLIVGVDYSGTQIADGTFDVTTGSGEPVPPIVVFKVPTTSRWVAGDKMGTRGADLKKSADENNTFSVRVDVPANSHGIFLRVTGDAQHAIAFGVFTPLPADEAVGKWNVGNGAIFTLAVPYDRHVEGKWPATPAARDPIVVKVIDAGDGYTRDYVTPSTVLGVAADGTLIRSTGGWIPKDGPNDAIKRLTALAKVAFAWYGIDHKVLTLSTYRIKPPSDLRPGDLVKQIGDAGNEDTINALVTQVRISTPLGSPESSQSPQMEITTFAGELDALHLMPEVPAAGAEVVGPSDRTLTGFSPRDRASIERGEFFSMGGL